MSLEGPARKLFEEIKYRHKFPPRGEAARIKSEMASRGMGDSSPLAQLVSMAYLTVVEGVLDEFAESVINKRDVLGLSDDVAVRHVIAVPLGGEP